MDDLRQGVTPAGHAALDELDALRAQPLPPVFNHGDSYAYAKQAKTLVGQALRTTSDSTGARFAIRAAAHLIRYAERVDASHKNLGITLFPQTGSTDAPGLEQAAEGAGSDASLPPSEAPSPSAADERADRNAAAVALEADARQKAEAEIERSSALSPAMVRLIIAARIVAFEDQGADALRELDQASEAFASAVPWDDEPDDDSPLTEKEEAMIDAAWEKHKAAIPQEPDQ